MRDSRRRSPESSRRRRRESRRDSREQQQQQQQQQPQLTNLPPMPMSQDSLPYTPYTQATTAPPMTAATTTTATDRGAYDYPGSYQQQQYQQPYQPYQPQQQQQQPYQYPPQPSQQHSSQHQRPRAPSSSNSSSSSLSSSLLDISRHYPASRFGGVFGTFFRAPSERSRLRRRRSGKARKRRILYFGNSSSSSVNSDLAYGNGYIARPKGRSFSPRESFAAASAGTAAAAGVAAGVAAGSSQHYRGPAAGYATDGSNRPGQRRAKTDEEILELGRQLQDFARKQNEHDLKAAGRVRPSGLMAAAATVSDFRRKKRDGPASRGIGSSRPHDGSSGDDSDWESASDGESSDGADSELAYGSVVSHAIRPAAAAVAGAAAGAAVASTVGGRSTHGRQTSAVDPRLFGPVNSLHGLVTPQPFRDGDSAVPAAQYRDFNRLRRAETEPIRKTTDPTKFDAETASAISRQGLPYRSRPEPVPLQQPVPKTPVSPKVYQAEKLEEASRKDSRDHRTRTEDKGLSDAAMAGIGMAAAGAAAMAFNRKKSREERKSDRRDDRKDERSDKRDSREYRDYRDDDRRDRDRRSEKSDKTEKDPKRKDKEPDRDKERRSSKRDSYSSKYADDREHKRSSRHEDDETPRKKRETAVDHYPEPQTRTYRNGEIEVELDAGGRSEVSRSSRRDSRKYDDRDDRRDLYKAEKAGPESADDPGNHPPQRTPVDPFQYQIHDNDLAAPDAGPARPLTPTVVTVDREPTFSDWAPRPSIPDARLSRKDSFEIEQMVEDYKKGAQGAPRSPEPRRRNTYEEEEKAAKDIYEETKHSTIPAAAGVIAAAVAVETIKSRSRSRSRNRYDERSNGDRRERMRDVDEVQERANRAYRESVIARKIAEDEIRSRSQTPDRSVVDRYKEDAQDETKIVSPPQYEDSHQDPDKNPYDKPNADVRIDNKIFPKEIHKFRANGLDASLFRSRDPSCERDRPLLNLVYPTPVSSRQATPSPDHAKREKDTQERREPSSRSVPEVVVEADNDASQPSPAKSVTWGENSTKSFEVETPEPRSDTEPSWDKAEEKPRPRLNQSSQWGMIAAAIAGSSREPANEIEVIESKEHDNSKPRDFGAGGPEHSFADDSGAPPVPGPKPPSPHPERMPGGFGDDIEFAATLAAGLKDTGFDPNIVIDDPAYRRRDSPPGESEPNGDGWNHTSFADVVTNLTGAPNERSVPDPGYVVGEVETPRDEPAADEWAEVPAKLSKKDKKKLEKLKRQSLDMSEPAAESSETPTFDDAAEAPEKLSKKEQRKRDKAAKAQALAQDESWTPVAESEPSQDRDAGEDFWEETGRKKSKKNRKSRDLEDDASSKVSVPTDAFEDLQSLRNVDPNDEWDTAKQSKKKSKRDSGVYESTSRAASEVSAESSSKRSSKSKRRSGVDDDFDDYGDQPPDTRTSDPFEDREVTSVVSEGRFDDDRKREKREKRRSSRYDDDDTKSVASAPGGSSRRSKDKESETRSSRYDDDDTKSVASAPGGSSRRSRDKDSDSRRSSRYDDDDTKSVASAPDSSSRRSKDKDVEKRSSGLFSSIFKSKDDKKDSFLGNAGTPGAGAGFATAAAAAAAYMAASRSHATEEEFDKGADTLDRAEEARDFDAIDPEVAPRAIKPAIDPQYGDLLPLPPSEPGSPTHSPEELPTLPDSRPDTPPDERNLKREYTTHRRRRSAQETPVKSPSRTAIPISLRLGHRASPSTPGSGTFRSPPLDSPGSAPDSATRRQGRHISWDSSREIKPLYLLEHSRHNSADAIPQQDDLPELPPSEPSSRESPAPEFGDAYDVAHRGLSAEDLADTGLRIDTSVAQLAQEQDLAGSQETTPKADAKPEFQELPPLRNDDQSAMYVEPDPVEPMSKDRSSYLLRSTPSSVRSNKTIDSDDFASSHWGSSPSKRLGVDDALPDVMEDLTSADEHFSDAREGTPDDSFEEAHSWPAGPPAKEQPAEEPSPEKAMPEETSTALEEAEPAEWQTMTATEKKKAKKARKNKGLDLVEAAAATAAVGTAAAIITSASADDTAKEDTPSSQPEPSQDEFEQPKKGKKGKKNKRKSLSWEDTVGEKPVEPAAEEPVVVEHAEVPEVVLARDDTPADTPAEVSDIALAKDISLPPSSIPTDFAPKDESLEGPADGSTPRATDDPVEAVTETGLGPSDATEVVQAVDAPATEQVPEETPREAEPAQPAEEDFWMAPTKKSKKKKKGRAAMAWDESPPTEIEAPADDVAAPADEPAEGAPKELPELTDPPAGEVAVPVEEPTITAETEPAADEPAASAPEAEAATEPNPDDFWSTPSTSKKDKKKKKKGKQAAMAWDDDTAPTESGTQTPAETVNPEQSSVQELTEPASEARTPDVAETPAQTEAIIPAAEPAAEADAEDLWSTPASSKKDKKKKKKGKQAMVWDEPQTADTESQTPSTEEEKGTDTLASDQPPEPIQDEAKVLDVDDSVPLTEAAMGEATLVEPGNSSQQEAASSFSDQPPTTDPDDEWSVPATSKKDKKKKKRKSLQLDEPAPAETADEPPVEVAQKLDRPADEPVDRAVEPPIEDATSTALESDFAPVTKGKKKKNKRKSVQWEPEETPAAPEPEREGLDKSLDIVSTEEAPAPLESIAQDESTAEGRNDSTPAQGEPTAEGRNDPSLALAAATAAAASATALAASLGHDAAADIPTEETKDTTEVTDREADQPRPLESHISEPLFSQDDGPSQLTQEPSSIEPTQADESTPDEKEPVAEPAPEATFEDFAAPKKKGKKNKKKSQSSVWDLLEEDSSPKPETESVAPADVPLDDVQAAGEPSAMQADEVAAPTNPIDDETEPLPLADEQVSRELSADTPQVEAPESQTEDEWDRLISGKKSKKSKKKGSKSGSPAEQEPVVESSSELVVEPVALTEEPTSLEEPLADVTTDQPSQESAAVDEWPQVTGKKGKKKKRQSQMSSTWDDEPAASTALAEAAEPAETSAPSVDPEAEFEVPKKGKKGKKKKNTFSWDSLDVETPPESESKPRDLAQDDVDVRQPEAVPADAEVQPESEAVLPAEENPYGDDAPDNTIVEPEKPSEPESMSVADEPPEQPIPETGPVEAPAADESEFLFPVKMSKKDKKKKKKQAALDEATQLDSAEGTGSDDKIPTMDLADLEPKGGESPSLDRTVEEPTVPEVATMTEDTGQQEEAASGDTPGAGEQQSEANPDDEWGGFSLKKSKKDKKKKKAKNVEPEIPQEPETTTSPEPEPDTLDTTADQATESSRMDIDPVVETVKDDAEPVISQAEPSAEVPATEEVAVPDEADKKEDDDWSFGLSKKDKKKKKKAKALELAADESSPPSEADSSREVESAKEPVVDDFWSAPVSKKDKKKKRKSTLAVESDAFDESSAPTEDITKSQIRPDVEALPDTTVNSSAPLDLDQDSAMKDELADVAPVDPVAPVAEETAQDTELERNQVEEGLAEPELLPSEQAPGESKPEDDMPEPNPDDEWSVSVTTKKGKKGKKGRKSQVEALPWDEPEAESSNLPITEPAPKPEEEFTPADEAAAEIAPPPSEDAVVVPQAEDTEMGDSPATPLNDTDMPDASRDVPGLSIQESAIPDAGTGAQDVPEQQADATKPDEEPPLEAQSQNDAVAEDTWDTMPQRKLSKKDKKKKKKQESLMEESAEPSTDVSREDLAPVSQHPEETVSATLDDTESSPAFAEEVSAEPEEWLPTKKSKKDKKKAQKLAATALGAAAGVAAAGMAAGDSADTATDEAPEPKPAEESPQPTFSSWADEMDEAAPIDQPETLPQDPQPPPEVEDDGFGFQMTTKKSKKGKKKGRASLGPAELNAEAVPTSEAEQQSDPAAADDQRMETGGELSRGVDNIEPQTTSRDFESAAPAEAEDEWAMPVKKKGKKGKKAKGSGTMTPADEPEVVAMPDVAAPEQLPEDVPQAELEETREAAPEATDPPPAVPEPPQPADEVDNWAFTTKKGKKGKKGRKSSGIATPVNEPELSPESPPVEVAQEVAEPTASDSPIQSDAQVFDALEPPVEQAAFAPSPPEDHASTHDVLMPDQVAESALPREDADALAEVSEPSAPAQADEATADDAWAFPVKKKGKKGKKGKSSSGSMTPVVALDDQEAVVDTPAEDKDRALPSQEAATAEETTPVDVPLEAEESRAIQEPTPPVEAEDEWAMPSKKKKGKGKKNKGIPLSAFDEPATAPVEPVQPETPNVDDSQAASSASVEAAEAKPAAMEWKPEHEQPAADDAMDVDARGGPSEPTGSLEPEPIIAEPEAAPVEASPEDTWAMPGRKKSKKEKKRKSSQVMVLDTLRDDAPVQEEAPREIVEDIPAVEGDSRDQPASDNWFDDFSVPKSQVSVTKSKKKKGKKGVEAAPVRTPPTQEPAAMEEASAKDIVPIEQPSLDAMEDMTGGTADDEATQSGANAFDDVWESDPRLPGNSARAQDMSAFASNEFPVQSKASDGSSRDVPATSTKDDSRARSSSGGGDVAAAAGALSGGVALLAERFGGGKKKKKGKQSKIVDKRQQQEDDLFDDPALWEGADKKSLQADKGAIMGDSIAGGNVEVGEPSKAKEVPITAMSESFTESESGWKETARQGARLDDEFAESPVLGRGEMGSMSPQPVGLLRRGSEVEEPVGGLLREREEEEARLGSLSPAVSEFRRSPTRALPAVEEVPEAEDEATKLSWPTPEMNRDSGFAAESPNPTRRRSNLFSDEEAQRDSGVHTGDWIEGMPRAMPRTPEPPHDKRSRHSPYGTPVLVRDDTPVLRGPVGHAEATPEPEKRLRRTQKSYGELGGDASSSRGLAAPRRQAVESAAQDRSVSDGVAMAAHHQHQRQLDLQQGPSPRAEPRRSASNTSLSRHRTPEPLRLRPESPGITRATATPTPPLRRVDKRMSGDLRALRQQSSSSNLAGGSRSSTPTTAHAAAALGLGAAALGAAAAAAAASSSSASKLRKDKSPSSSSTSPPPPPVANESRVRSSTRDGDKDMADVFDGYGEGRIGSPRSPTRPHSMRRRQSMQVLELESRVQQLLDDNRALTEARAHAEQNLSQRAATVLSDRDAEIEALKQSLQFLQNEVNRLTEVNEGLASANAELASKDNSARYADLEVRHATVSRELDEARGAHTGFDETLQAKDAEIADLRAQLEAAKEQIREMQRKILDSKSADAHFLDIKDEDYFDNRCQQLCSHVQQWVLRFSKFSDMRACRLTNEINDEKTIDRLDNAVLDGSDVDTYLNDRVKRRDIFMSMTMNMIWEFVFTRYLFGMDREQRQKLKSLEKLLLDVGPSEAVRQWRAVTLTLLSRRENFKSQRDLDTEAVVQAIFQTLCKILPPPSNLEDQIQSQLRRVMREAVDLSVEMRTQRAEYMMLPPLQPEYDADGELAATVQFDASMMNERSGKTAETNEELEARGAIVRIVLFPLVVKRGDDAGVGEDKIVVCPAQVLIARDKSKRHLTPSSDAGGASLGAPSRVSVVTEHMGTEADYMEGGI